MSTNNLLAAAKFSPISLQSPDGWTGHMPFAAWLITEFTPRIFVELGTHSGNSYFAFCQTVHEANLATKCYAVDTWKGDEHSGYYDEHIFEHVNSHNQEYYGAFSRLLRMTFDEAAHYFADASIDLLHIDGLHTYEAVKNDFETWMPRLAPGAVILFHDINVRENNFGVWKLWEELKEKYPSTLEFVHSHGLGVLQLANGPAEKELPFLVPGAEQSVLQRYFAALGVRQTERLELKNLRNAIVDQEAQITRLHQAVSEREERITSLDQAVSERDGQIAALHQGLGQRDEQIVTLRQGIAQQEEELVRLQQGIGERDEEIAGLYRNVAERDGQIVDLHQGIFEMEGQIVRQKGTLCERDEQILILKCAGIEKDNQMQISVQERDAQIASLRQVLAERNEYIENVMVSTSWRMTAPFRYLSVRARRVLFGCRMFPQKVKQVGGLRYAARRAISIFRREGMAGLRRSIETRLQSAYADEMAACFGQPTATITFCPQSGYALTNRSASYTYVPPSRPTDLERTIANMTHTPLFSVVVPVYNTPPDMLTKAVDSVNRQWYPHWELILADDNSTQARTRETLAQLEGPGITVLKLPENKGIAAATNAALDQATGEFIVLLDHDDELSEDCLYELALCINRDNPDFIYSDEDKITPEGRFSEPHFKPEWSPDTMMSTMYVCHVACIRRSLLVEVGGLRSDYDGCQDWDMVLRITEKTKRIRHIPKVLYHWRINSDSIAGDIAAKPYVANSSKRVREDALRRRGLKGTVEPLESVKGYFRVNYHLVGNPLISIIIPSKDNSSYLRRCLDSILEKSSYRNFEVIVIDNGSREPATLAYLDILTKHKQILVIGLDVPFNFSKLINHGCEQARGEILLFLNDDTEVISADWLERMGGYAQLPHVGAVGAKLLYPGGREIQHAGIVNFEDGPGHAFVCQNPDKPGYYMRNLLEYNWLAVTGACLMIERSKFLEVGGFNETFPIAYNDVEFCIRLVDSGYYNVVCQSVRLTHHESVSRGLDHLNDEKHARLKKERRLLFETHPRYFQYDPFHSPNLHPNGVHFEVTT